MATLRLWMASAYHFDLVLAGCGLYLMGRAALGLSSWGRVESESAGLVGSAVRCAILATWARGWAKLAQRWAAGADRRFRRAQDLAEREGLFDE